VAENHVVIVSTIVIAIGISAVRRALYAIGSASGLASRSGLSRPVGGVGALREECCGRSEA